MKLKPHVLAVVFLIVPSRGYGITCNELLNGKVVFDVATRVTGKADDRSLEIARYEAAQYAAFPDGIASEDFINRYSLIRTKAAAESIVRLVNLKEQLATLRALVKDGPITINGHTKVWLQSESSIGRMHLNGYQKLSPKIPKLVLQTDDQIMLIGSTELLEQENGIQTKFRDAGLESTFEYSWQTYEELEDVMRELSDKKAAEEFSRKYPGQPPLKVRPARVKPVLTDIEIIEDKIRTYGSEVRIEGLVFLAQQLDQYFNAGKKMAAISKLYIRQRAIQKLVIGEYAKRQKLAKAYQVIADHVRRHGKENGIGDDIDLSIQKEYKFLSYIEDNYQDEERILEVVKEEASMLVIENSFNSNKFTLNLDALKRGELRGKAYDNETNKVNNFYIEANGRIHGSLRALVLLDLLSTATRIMDELELKL